MNSQFHNKLLKVQATILAIKRKSEFFLKMKFIVVENWLGWVDQIIKTKSPHVEPKPAGKCPPCVCVRGGLSKRSWPSAGLRKFQRKPRKTPNDQVHKSDRGLNRAPPVFQFRELPFCHWLGPSVDKSTPIYVYVNHNYA